MLLLFSVGTNLFLALSQDLLRETLLGFELLSRIKLALIVRLLGLGWQDLVVPDWRECELESFSEADTTLRIDLETANSAPKGIAAAHLIEVLPRVQHSCIRLTQNVGVTFFLVEVKIGPLERDLFVIFAAERRQVFALLVLRRTLLFPLNATTVHLLCGADRWCATSFDVRVHALRAIYYCHTSLEAANVTRAAELRVRKVRLGLRLVVGNETSFCSVSHSNTRQVYLINESAHVHELTCLEFLALRNAAFFVVLEEVAWDTTLVENLLGYLHLATLDEV